jgi:hypothetical protein
MKKRSSVNKGAKHTFRGDGYIHMTIQMVRHVRHYFKDMHSFLCY